MKNTITSRELAACAQAASKRAVERAQAKQIPYTVQEGRNIVKHAADGSTIIVQTLPKAYVKPTSKHFKIT